MHSMSSLIVDHVDVEALNGRRQVSLLHCKDWKVSYMGFNDVVFDSMLLILTYH